MNAEQMGTLVNMRLGGYSDHQCLMQELTFKNEKLIAIESENARLREALREMAEVLERFTCPECDPASTVCRAVDGLPCEVVMLPRKAREVLGE